MAAERVLIEGPVPPRLHLVPGKLVLPRLRAPPRLDADVRLGVAVGAAVEEGLQLAEHGLHAVRRGPAREGDKVVDLELTLLKHVHADVVSVDVGVRHIRAEDLHLRRHRRVLRRELELQVQHALAAHAARGGHVAVPVQDVVVDGLRGDAPAGVVVDHLQLAQQAARGGVADDAATLLRRLLLPLVLDGVAAPRHVRRPHVLLVVLDRAALLRLLAGEVGELLGDLCTPRLHLLLRGVHVLGQRALLALCAVRLRLLGEAVLLVLLLGCLLLPGDLGSRLGLLEGIRLDDHRVLNKTETTTSSPLQNTHNNNNKKKSRWCSIVNEVQIL
eukprot:Rhum_TRINITY_DN15211_c13_g1::Rhum_TRINITY_DN15211_c13_g1_i1::g.144986::m.144986